MKTVKKSYGGYTMKKRSCKQCNKKFTPATDKQNDCSPICLANRFDTYVKKTRALAKIFAWTQGFRSMSEVRFAALLQTRGIDYNYERHTVVYQHNPQKYTVDFTVKSKKGEDIHFEYKGKLDGPTRKKLRAIKKSNPRMDLRLVFEKPNNKIYKGAKMRYFEWAERNKIPWYNCKDIKAIEDAIAKG